MATATKPTEADFHIAAICALYLEATEVERMFDESFTHLQESVSQGNNTYAVTPGRIGRQNIILMWMNSTGKTDATRAAQALKSTYKNIRLCFVVGICGGVPKIHDAAGNEVEVVLGDVVISTEILKHDERKTYDSSFEIASPPVKLSSEVTSFMKPRLAGRRRDALQDRLHEIMAQVGQAPRYPGVDKDHLYDSKYPHKHHEGCRKCKERGVCDDALEDDCTTLGCDTAKLVERVRLKHVGPHKHAIQFGIVASGHTVMKSGKEREEIAIMPKYKRRVVAFEMESAGICEDGLDVVVIKSVCDYADSHKKKSWQQYTAFVGAAAFRAFVEAWGTRNQRGLTRIVSKFQHIPQSVKIVTHGLENTASPCQGFMGPEEEHKINTGTERNLAVPCRSQHRRGSSSTSLRSFFRKGGQDSPTTTSPTLNLHHATILSPKGDPSALQNSILSEPSQPPPLQLSSQTRSEPYSPPQPQVPYRPPLESTPQYRAGYSQISPPLDDSSQFPTSTSFTYDPRIAPQHFSQSTELNRKPPTPPRTPPQTSPQDSVARFSTHASEGRSSMTSIDRSSVLASSHRRSSASGTTTASLYSIQSQGKIRISESSKFIDNFIAACEDRNLAKMEEFLTPRTIDLTSSTDDGSNVLHLALGTGDVAFDEQRLVADAVDLLCKYGANVNGKDRFGSRPLHYCARTMNQKAAEVLLNHKAKINYTDPQGHTALNVLAEEFQPDVRLVEFLLSKGGRLGKNARMSPLPPRPTRQQNLVRRLLAGNNVNN